MEFVDNAMDVEGAVPPPAFPGDGMNEPPMLRDHYAVPATGAMDATDGGDGSYSMAMDQTPLPDMSVPATPSAAEEEAFGAYVPPALAPETATMSVKCFLNRPFNTTSTVVAANTMANPDMGQIFFWYVAIGRCSTLYIYISIGLCDLSIFRVLFQMYFSLASVIQAQIVEDDDQPPINKALHPEFDLTPIIKPEYGGDGPVLTKEMIDIDAPDDPVLRHKLQSRLVPTVDTIVRFMKLLQGCAKYSVECNILALVYMNRMSSTHHLALTAKNWRAIWITCVILAQKMWDDRPLKTSAFVLLVPPLTKTDLRNFEKKALQLLDYSIGVKASLYVKYYFELRQLFTNIIGFKESDWLLKPLSIIQSRRLDVLADRGIAPRIKATAESATKAAPYTAPAGNASAAAHENQLSTAVSVASLVSNSRMVDAAAGKKTSLTLEDATLESHARFIIS